MRAGNFSLIKDYKLIIDGKTEVRIRQAESQPIPGNKVSISISDNMIIIKDTANKALVFSVVSRDNIQVLEQLKKSCLDNLADANCLGEFIEKFYTLFDPFGLEYQYFSDNGPMLAKLVKDEVIDEKFAVYPNPVVDYLYLQSSDDKIGPVKVYDISSGQNVLSANLEFGQNSLDLTRLRKGNYLLVCGERRFKIVK